MKKESNSMDTIKPESLKWFLSPWIRHWMLQHSPGLSPSAKSFVNPAMPSCHITWCHLDWLCAWCLQPRLMWRCLQREERAHFSLHSISVSQAWAGDGKGPGLLWQGGFGWVRWIQCGWWVDLAANMKTCQWQQVGRIYLQFFNAGWRSCSKFRTFPP